MQGIGGWVSLDSGIDLRRRDAIADSVLIPLEPVFSGSEFNVEGTFWIKTSKPKIPFPSDQRRERKGKERKEDEGVVVEEAPEWKGAPKVEAEFDLYLFMKAEQGSRNIIVVHGLAEEERR
ncbi:hypothetical protein BGX24_004499 [Mortierella sp. AD032]|nr:hypothetical protein BGX24_004499 [Mortierella sp. AD032]